MGVEVVMKRESDLFEIVLALRSAGSFASLLYSREQQGDEDGNNGDYDEKLNQGEASFGRSIHGALQERKSDFKFGTRGTA